MSVSESIFEYFNIGQTPIVPFLGCLSDRLCKLAVRGESERIVYAHLGYTELLHYEADVLGWDDDFSLSFYCGHNNFLYICNRIVTLKVNNLFTGAKISKYFQM